MLALTLRGPRLRCMHKRGNMATMADSTDTSPRRSAERVKQELLQSYKIVEDVGRGVIYFGSSRIPPTHPHFALSRELSKELGLLLKVPAWSGIGYGLMDAVCQGAAEAGVPAAGFKIVREGGKWVGAEISWDHPYLPKESYFTCEFFSARKHAFVDAGIRQQESDKTAFIALPGGIGTLDEIFEVMALIQLDRISTLHSVPFLLMNYDGFYDKMIEFMKEMEAYGTVAPGEVASLWKVCNTNGEAVDYIKDFYKL